MSSFGSQPALERAPHRWHTLAVLCLSLFCLSLDNTKLLVAMPTLARTFADEPGALAWLPEAYLLTYASALPLGGALSERFGARRMLLLGSAAFTLTSLWAAAAHSAAALVLARACMGVSGALMTPATLASVKHLFAEDERGRAIAIWTASFSVGSAAGPPLAGWLLQQHAWSVLMLVNAPVGLAMLAGAYLLVSGELPRRTVPLDLLSTALALGAAVSVIFTILLVPRAGFRGAELWLSLASSVGLCALFYRWQLRSRNPLFDLRLLARPRLRASLSVIVLAYGTFAAVSFALAQFLQLVRGHAPLTAGQLNLPLAAAMLAGTLAAPLLAARRSGVGALRASLLCAAAGSASLALACATGSDVLVCLAQLPFGAGAGSAFAVATDTVISAAPAERAGSVAALNESAFEFGGVLGVAIASSVLALDAQIANNAVHALLAGSVVLLAAASLVTSKEG